MKKTIILLSIAIFLTSCVSQKKYNEALQKSETNARKLKDCNKENLALSESITALQKDLQTKNQNIEDLIKGDKKSADLVKHLNKENSDLKAQLDAANSKINEIMADKSEHLAELSDALYSREKELNEKEGILDSLQREFAENQRQMKELKTQLAGKEEQLNKIQNTLKDALLGFADKGLSIENKNGKVYVLMEEKLLFQSGM